MTFALIVMCKYDGTRAVESLAVSSTTVGRTRINAHIAPRIVKITITNGSPKRNDGANDA